MSVMDCDEVNNYGYREICIASTKRITSAMNIPSPRRWEAATPFNTFPKTDEHRIKTKTTIQQACLSIHPPRV